MPVKNKGNSPQKKNDKQRPSVKKPAEGRTKRVQPSGLNQPIDDAAQLSAADAEDLQKTYGNNFVQQMASAGTTDGQGQSGGDEEAVTHSDRSNDTVVSRAGKDKLGGATVNGDLENQIGRKRGGGQTLPEDVRGQMEHQFRADFTDVRIHDDADSDSLNRSLNAEAFTTGSDIFFAEGKYNPHAESGQKLLAHELTHVIQQGGSKQKPQTKQENDKSQENAGQETEQEQEAVANEAVGQPQLAETLPPDPKPNPQNQALTPDQQDKQSNTAEPEPDPKKIVEEAAEPPDRSKPETEKAKQKTETVDAEGSQKKKNHKDEHLDPETAKKKEKEKKKEAKEAAQEEKGKKEEDARKKAEKGKQEKKDKDKEKKKEKDEKEKKGKGKGKEGKKEKKKPKSQVKALSAEDLDGETAKEKRFDPEAMEFEEPEEQPLLPTWDELASGTVQLSLADVQEEYGARQNLGVEAPANFSEISTDGEVTAEEGAGAQEGPQKSGFEMANEALAQGALSGLQEGASSFIADQAVQAATAKVPYADGLISLVQLTSDPKGWVQDNVFVIGDSAVKMAGAFKAIGDESTGWGYIAATLEAFISVVDFINSIVGLINTIFTIILFVAKALLILSNFMISLAPVGTPPPVFPFAWTPGVFSPIASLMSTIISFLDPVNNVLSTIGNILINVKFGLQPLAILFRYLDMVEAKGNPEELEKKQAKLQENVSGFVSTATTKTANNLKDNAISGVKNRVSKRKAKKEIAELQKEKANIGDDPDLDAKIAGKKEKFAEEFGENYEEYTSRKSKWQSVKKFGLDVAGVSTTTDPSTGKVSAGRTVDVDGKQKRQYVSGGVLGAFQKTGKNVLEPYKRAASLGKATWKGGKAAAKTVSTKSGRKRLKEGAGRTWTKTKKFFTTKEGFKSGLKGFKKGLGKAVPSQLKEEYHKSRKDITEELAKDAAWWQRRQANVQQLSNKMETKFSRRVEQKVYDPVKTKIKESTLAQTRPAQGLGKRMTSEYGYESQKKKPVREAEREKARQDAAIDSADANAPRRKAGIDGEADRQKDSADTESRRLKDQADQDNQQKKDDAQQEARRQKDDARQETDQQKRQAKDENNEQIHKAREEMERKKNEADQEAEQKRQNAIDEKNQRITEAGSKVKQALKARKKADKKARTSKDEAARKEAQQAHTNYKKAKKEAKEIRKRANQEEDRKIKRTREEATRKKKEAVEEAVQRVKDADDKLQRQLNKANDDLQKKTKAADDELQRKINEADAEARERKTTIDRLNQQAKQTIDAEAEAKKNKIDEDIFNARKKKYSQEDWGYKDKEGNLTKFGRWLTTVEPTGGQRHGPGALGKQLIKGLVKSDQEKREYERERRLADEAQAHLDSDEYRAAYAKAKGLSAKKWDDKISGKVTLYTESLRNYQQLRDDITAIQDALMTAMISNQNDDGARHKLHLTIHTLIPGLPTGATRANSGETAFVTEMKGNHFQDSSSTPHWTTGFGSNARFDSTFLTPYWEADIAAADGGPAWIADESLASDELTDFPVNGHIEKDYYSLFPPGETPARLVVKPQDVTLSFASRSGGRSQNHVYKPKYQKVEEDGGNYDVWIGYEQAQGHEKPRFVGGTKLPNALEGNPYQHTVTATDPDEGENLQITAQAKPAWLTLTDNKDGTATLAGTPPPSAAGVAHSVSLQVKDQIGLVNESTFTVTVQPNHAPRITSSPPPASATEGQLYQHTVTAEDDDEVHGDQLTVSLPAKPEWLTLKSDGDGTAVLSGTPTADSVGQHRLKVQVQDRAGEKESQQVSITVDPAPAPEENGRELQTKPSPEDATSAQLHLQRQPADDEEPLTAETGSAAAEILWQEEAIADGEAMPSEEQESTADLDSEAILMGQSQRLDLEEAEEDEEAGYASIVSLGRRSQLLEQLPAPPGDMIERVQGASLAYSQLEVEEYDLRLQQQQIGALKEHSRGQRTELKGVQILTQVNKQGVEAQQRDADTQLETQETMKGKMGDKEAHAKQTEQQGQQGENFFSQIFGKIIEGFGFGSMLGMGQDADAAGANKQTKETSEVTGNTADMTKSGQKEMDQRQARTMKVKADADKSYGQLDELEGTLNEREEQNEEGLGELGEAGDINEEQFEMVQEEKERLTEEHLTATEEAEEWADEHRSVREEIFDLLEEDLSAPVEEQETRLEDLSM